MDLRKGCIAMCFVIAFVCMSQALESDEKAPNSHIEKRALRSSSSSSVSQPSAQFGQSFPDESGMNLQLWRDYMSKRNSNFGTAGIEHLQPPSLASWKHWMDRKRSFSNNDPFTNQGHFDDSRFQNWSGWLKKRFYSNQGEGYPFGSAFKSADPHGKMQSWSTLAKRSMFGSGFKDMDSNERLQSYDDWLKRGGNARRAYFGGHTFQNIDSDSQLQSFEDWLERDPNAAKRASYFGSSYHDFGSEPPMQSFKDWAKRQKEGSNPTKRSADKRFFNRASSNFGLFDRYFTDNLQDWRNTFKGMKRSQDTNKVEAN